MCLSLSLSVLFLSCSLSECEANPEKWQGRRQTFVDVGCGNGFLTCLLHRMRLFMLPLLLQPFDIETDYSVHLFLYLATPRCRK